MKTYARIGAAGQVVELISTDRDIRTLYHPDLVWVDATGTPGVAAGWTWNGSSFAPPASTPGASAPPAPTIASLQAQLNRIAAQLAALAAGH
jgi:hypothetical protein